MGLISTLKGLATNKHTRETYAELSDIANLDQELLAAHTLRGRAGHMDQGQEGFEIYPEDIEKIQRYQALKNRLDETTKSGREISDSDKDLMSKFDDHIMDMSYKYGFRDLDPIIKKSPTVLDRPLYVTRTEGAIGEDYSNMGEEALHSVMVVDPENPDSYMKVYEGMNEGISAPSQMYRLDPGKEIFHPSGVADQNEAIVRRGALNESKSMPEADYISELAKGTAPFALGGAALLAGDDALADNKPETYPNLEAIATLASSAALEPFSGLAGIIGSILPGDAGQGVEWIDKIQSLGYEPEDTSSLQTIGEALAWPIEQYERGTDWLGDNTLKSTGSPTLAAIAKTSPEIIGSLWALNKLAKAGRLAGKTKGSVDRTGRRDFLKKAGVVGAGAALAHALPGKGLLGGASSPAAKTATILATPSGAPMVTATPNGARLATLIKAFPELDADDFIKTRGEGFLKQVDDLEPQMAKDLTEQLNKFNLDDIDNAIEILDDPNGLKNIQLDTRGTPYDSHMNNQDFMYGDWIQGGNIDDNIGNAAYELRDIYDTEFGEIVDPISGDRGVFSDKDFLKGPTMEFSEGGFEKLKLIDPKEM